MKEILKRKTVKLGLLIIILLVAAVIIGINVQSAQRQKEYDNHIQAAQKYLTELDYEQAIAEYMLAYEIEPSEEVLDALEQTYLAYVQSYVDAGDYERAISVLEEGYAQIGRESLRERIEELQAEMEAGVQGQSEDEHGELWQMVASQDFGPNLAKIINSSSRLGQHQHITDEQMNEVCTLFINAIEQYTALTGNDHVYYNRMLLDLNIISENYEGCKELKRKLDESYLDWDPNPSEHMLDEYGRTYWYKAGASNGPYSGSWEENREFDDHGRVVKETGYTAAVTHPDEVAEDIRLYEYDAEGRLIKYTWSVYAPLVDEYNMNSESIFIYEYNQKGFTEHCTITAYSDIDHGNAISYHDRSRDCVVDEYGGVTYGEYYDENNEYL